MKGSVEAVEGILVYYLVHRYSIFGSVHTNSYSRVPVSGKPRMDMFRASLFANLHRLILLISFLNM